MVERMTGYFRTAEDGVFTPAAAFEWSLRYPILCDSCFIDFTPFVGGDVTFGATAEGCALGPDPAFFGDVSCIFVSAIFVSCVGVFCKIVQLLS
jgi:hypothetical protein